MQDLVNKLSNEDRYKIKLYVKRKICNDDKNFDQRFIGLSNYLEHWNKSKQKLYKLLDNNFIVKKQLNINNESELKEDLRQLYNGDTEDYNICNSLKNFFWVVYHRHNAYTSFFNTKDWKDEDIDVLKEIYDDFWFICNEGTLYGTSDFSCKHCFPNHSKKLCISKGTKFLKKIKIYLDYFEEEFIRYEKNEEHCFNSKIDIERGYEHFRLEHSKILNRKKNNVEAYFSIHPLDYLTMSDNANDWTSCMSQNEKGCYRQGALELMNSNNVVMCYIKSDSIDLNLNTAPDLDHLDKKLKAKDNTPKMDRWNSKIFRVFFVVTKDGIISGKSYPYKSNDYTKALLKELQNMVKDKFGWTYTYDIQRYKDLCHVGCGHRMQNMKDYVYSDRKRKEYGKTLAHHKIILETHGYYNDWAYNSEYEFWCVRNKVDRTRVITISGKTICPYCGDPIVVLNNSEYEELSERYDYCSSDFCRPCKKKMRQIGEWDD